jgi:glycosyltransferase involved in cell wall biosynthesis
MSAKIIFVCPKSPRESYGGIENYTINLAKRLNKDFDIEIFCTAQKPKSKVTFEGVVLREFQETKLPLGVRNYSGALVKALKKSDAQIVHASGYNTLAPLMAMFAKKKKQKLIINLGGGISTSFARAVLEMFHTAYLKLNNKKIDYFIAVSKFEVNRFKKVFKSSKFVLIPNGIDFLPESKITKRKKQIVTASRLVKLKGIHFLLNSFSKVLEKDPGFKLVIIGGGPERKNLELQAKRLGVSENVKFTGAIPLSQHDKVINYFRESMLSVFLSSHESYGIAVVESIITNTPVIVSNRAALKEFAGCNLAIAFQQNNSEGIANKIIEISKNPKSYFQKKKEIDNCYLIKSWDEVALETKKLYNKLLK